MEDGGGQMRGTGGQRVAVMGDGKARSVAVG